jgi:DNA-binding transcriptional LysR family regulator
MSIRQASYVIAVVEEGSFSRAAARMRVAQPTLSQQVRALERRLGGALLERLGGDVRPTPAGRAFVLEARAAVRALERAERSARAVNEGREGDLEVACVSTVASALMPEALRRLRVVRPDVVVRLIEVVHRDLLESRVRAGLGDVAVGPKPVHWEGPQRLVGEQRFCVVLPESMASTQPDPVCLADLAQTPWVLFPPDYGLADLVTSACAAAGFRPEAAAITSQADTAARLAAAGLGPALVPVGAVPPGLSHVVRAINPALARPIVAYTRGPFTPVIEALLDAFA